MTADPRRRVALLTGGTRGIGRAILHRMTAFIDEIHVFGRSAAALDELADAFPGRCVPHRLDLSDKGAVAAFIAGAGPLLRNTDVFVHCAGDGMPSAVASLSLEETERLMELHCLSFLRFVKAMAPGMVGRRNGRIVAIGSLSNLAPKPYMTAYAASKAALVKAAQCIAAELVTHDVSVNVVSPGSVETRLGTEGRKALARLTGRDSVAQRQDNLPSGRMLAPEDIVGVVEFLIQSPRATLTGQNIIVAGTTVMP